MEEKEKTYLLPMDREMHFRVKVASAKRNLSMKDFILLAIENEMAREVDTEEILPRESQVIPNEEW